MDIETFPEIENFQKLPRQVIVKGGASTFSRGDGARLSGIVINNIGHTLRDVRVYSVIFNANKLPLLSLSAASEPDTLVQGAIGSFTFHIKDYPEQIADYHLYANWKFDDRE